MSDIALDTSAAVALLVRSHDAHGLVAARIDARRPCLTAHSLAETYSVLTRLPGDARLAPADAVTLLTANFGETVLLDPAEARGLPTILAPVGIAGGAVYDGLVALAARAARLPLATRDRRAAATYASLDVEVEVIT